MSGTDLGTVLPLLSGVASLGSVVAAISLLVRSPRVQEAQRAFSAPVAARWPYALVVVGSVVGASYLIHAHVFPRFATVVATGDPMALVGVAGQLALGVGLGYPVGIALFARRSVHAALFDGRRE